MRSKTLSDNCLVALVMGGGCAYILAQKLDAGLLLASILHRWDGTVTNTNWLDPKTNVYAFLTLCIPHCPMDRPKGLRPLIVGRGYICPAFSGVHNTERGSKMLVATQPIPLGEAYYG